MSEQEELCRVLFTNAPDCPEWRERLWGAYLGPVAGGHRVALRNMPAGASFDPKCPKWGDEIVATGSKADGLRYDLQNGRILKRYES